MLSNITATRNEADNKQGDEAPSANQKKGTERPKKDKARDVSGSSRVRRNSVRRLKSESRSKEGSGEVHQQNSLHVSVKSSDETPIDSRLALSSAEGSAKVDKTKSRQSNNNHFTRGGRTQKKRFMDLKRVGSWNGASGAALEDEPFYHGYMARDEAERLLKKHGEFLVRKAEVRHVECVVVSVYWEEKCYHLAIQKTKNKNVYICEYCFDTIPDLIRYHHQTHNPVYKDGVSLLAWVQREEWQLYHEQVNLSKKLGDGEFGDVFRGSLTQGLFTKPVEVAVKTLKGNNLNVDDRITFLREANLMLKLNHKYVVRLYGVATQKEPIMIVMELCSGGSLVEAMRRSDPPGLETRRSYCKQVVSGMTYLEKEQVIHRDLAARNCLLDRHDNCKISDFGLSLYGKLHKENKMLKVPVRWLAPETLATGMYSSKTDVWSFGVLMFEVFSCGESPYKEIKNLRTLRKKVLKEGLRLQPPAETPPEDAAIMTECFETNPAKRPSFAQLKSKYKESTRSKLLPRLTHWIIPKSDQSESIGCST